MRQLIIVSATAASLRLTTRIAVLAGQFEVGVYCIQAARLAQLLEVITDQAGGQAFGHPAIGEVAVPQALGQHGLCLLLEQSAKFRLLDLGIGLVRLKLRRISPAPNSSKAFTLSPSRRRMKGAGKVCQRKWPRNTLFASQPERRVKRCSSGCRR